MTEIDPDEFKEMLLSIKEASEVYQNVERISEGFNGKSTPVVLAITTTLLAKVVHTASADKVSAKALLMDVMSRSIDILGLLFHEEEDDEDEDDEEEGTSLQ
jgi:hypothetical protein